MSWGVLGYPKVSWGIKTDRLYIFQKSWIKGVLPDTFKLDPKVMLPKQGKTDCNVTKSLWKM